MSRHRSFTICLVLALTVLLGACDWSQSRFGPGQTGAATNETAVGVANVSKLRLRWSQAGATPNLYAASGGLVVAGGVVYVSAPGNDPAVQALDALTGEGRWRQPIPDRNLSVDAALGGSVFVHGDSTLTALDAATGSVRWHESGGGNGAQAATVVDSTVYVTTPAAVWARAAATGQSHWMGATAGETVVSGPTVADGQVYVALRNGQLAALDAATGAQKWANGEASWFVTDAAADGGRVFERVTSLTGGSKLRVLDARTGAEIWSTSFSDITSQPAISVDGVFVATPTALAAFDRASGQLRWSVPVASTVATPSFANGVVYIGGTDGTVKGFDATTGTRRWKSAAVGRAINEAPAIANGMIYAQSVDGTVWAFGLPVSGAHIGVSPAFTDFGQMNVGSGGPAQTYTVTNFGDAPTSTLTASVSGADRLTFPISSDGCTGHVLAAGAACSIGGDFSPVRAGALHASIEVRATTGGSAAATVSGHGLGSALRIDPTGWEFGNVAVGASVAKTFTVTNTSAQNSGVVTAGLLTWVLTHDFSITADQCTGVALAAGASCHVSVTFRPTAAGAVVQALLLSSVDTVPATAVIINATGT